VIIITIVGSELNIKRLVPHHSRISRLITNEVVSKIKVSAEEIMVNLRAEHFDPAHSIRIRVQIEAANVSNLTREFLVQALDQEWGVIIRATYTGFTANHMIDDIVSAPYLVVDMATGISLLGKARVPR
jgi:hypothetical protein